MSPALTDGRVLLPEPVPILKLVGPKDCVTVKATVGLVTPERAAIMLVLPAVNPVAKPEELIVASPVLLLLQDT